MLAAQHRVPRTGVLTEPHADSAEVQNLHESALEDKAGMLDFSFDHR